MRFKCVWWFGGMCWWCLVVEMWKMCLENAMQMCLEIGLSSLMKELLRQKIFTKQPPLKCSSGISMSASVKSQEISIQIHSKRATFMNNVRQSDVSIHQSNHAIADIMPPASYKSTRCPHSLVQKSFIFIPFARYLRHHK